MRLRAISVSACKCISRMAEISDDEFDDDDEDLIGVLHDADNVLAGLLPPNWSELEAISVVGSDMSSFIAMAKNSWKKFKREAASAAAAKPKKKIPQLKLQVLRLCASNIAAAMKKRCKCGNKCMLQFDETPKLALLARAEYWTLDFKNRCASME